jgi:hypothetical protein
METLKKVELIHLFITNIYNIKFYYLRNLSIYFIYNIESLFISKTVFCG